MYIYYRAEGGNCDLWCFDFDWFWFWFWFDLILILIWECFRAWEQKEVLSLRRSFDICIHILYINIYVFYIRISLFGPALCLVTQTQVSFDTDTGLFWHRHRSLWSSTVSGEYTWVCVCIYTPTPRMRMSSMRILKYMHCVRWVCVYIRMSMRIYTHTWYHKRRGRTNVPRRNECRDWWTTRLKHTGLVTCVEYVYMYTYCVTSEYAQMCIRDIRERERERARERERERERARARERERERESRLVHACMCVHLWSIYTYTHTHTHVCVWERERETEREREREYILCFTIYTYSSIVRKFKRFELNSKPYNPTPNLQRHRDSNARTRQVTAC